MDEKLNFKQHLLSLWENIKKECMGCEFLQSFVILFNHAGTNIVSAGCLKIQDTASVIDQVKPVALQIKPFAILLVAEGFFDHNKKIVPVSGLLPPSIEKKPSEFLYGHLEEDATGLVHLVSKIEYIDGKKTCQADQTSRPPQSYGLFTQLLLTENQTKH